MNAQKSKEVMVEEILHHQPHQRIRKSRRKYNYLLILTFFIFMACTSNKEASQAIYNPIPTSQIEYLFNYYDSDQLDSIVHVYKIFQDKNYSLDSLPDSTRFRAWAAFGYGLNKTDNYVEALKAYHNSLEIAEEIYGFDHWKYGAIANNLALIYETLGKYQKAISFYKKDLAVNQSDKGQGETYNNLGGIYRKIQKYDSAVYYYQKAIELLPENLHYYPMDNLGNVYSDLKDWERAREYFEQAIRLGRSYLDEEDAFLVAASFNSLAYTYIVNQDYSEALISLTQAEKITHNDIKTRLTTYEYDIECLYRLEEYELALFSAREADSLLMLGQKNILSEKDKLFFVNQSRQFSDLGFQSSLALNDLENAFYFSERGKAAVLQELNAKSQRREFQAYNTLSIPGIQEKLGEQAALIAYQFTNDSLYAFVITQGDAQLLPLASAQASDLAIQFRKSISQLSKDYVSIAPRAFETLFAPLEPSLRGKEKLLIIPDGSLSYMPFEALLRKEPKNKEIWKEYYYANLGFLLRDYTIAYHNSATLALVNTPDLSYSQKFIGFAPSYFPQIKEGRLKKLEYAQKFMRGMPNIFEDARTFMHSANLKEFKNVLKEDTAQILHFDTHGVLNTSETDSSYIVFTDSLLYLKDILELNTSRFDLLVLSACRTGEGIYSEGEGVISLARAFMVAGSKNVIHSLWLARDRSTAALFTYFYQALAQGADYAKALRVAKLEMIKKPTVHPVVWSNFLLYGL